MPAALRVIRTARHGGCGTASSRTTEASSEPALLEETVLGTRQTEILAQGFAFVFPPKEAAPLQLRHDLVDKVVEAAGYVREHDVEPVAGVAVEPLLHLVGDHRRRADERQPAIAAGDLR